MEHRLDFDRRIGIDHLGATGFALWAFEIGA
jgi:hypothetical protein